MILTINGKQETVPDNISIQRYLEIKNVNPNMIACELNLSIIKRTSLKDTLLKEGDRLEILHMMGGG